MHFQQHFKTNHGIGRSDGKGKAVPEFRSYNLRNMVTSGFNIRMGNR